MKIAHTGLRSLYDSGDTRKLNPNHAARIRRILTELDAADSPRGMNRPGFRLHPLRGTRRGYWSVRVSGNWRIVFRFVAGEAVDVDLIDYH